MVNVHPTKKLPSACNEITSGVAFIFIALNVVSTKPVVVTRPIRALEMPPTFENDHPKITFPSGCARI